MDLVISHWTMKCNTENITSHVVLLRYLARYYAQLEPAQIHLRLREYKSPPSTKTSLPREASLWVKQMAIQSLVSRLKSSFDALARR